MREIEPDKKWKLKEGEYLEKTKKGKYRIIHPIKDEEGKINLKNLFIGGSWTNLFVLMWIISLLLFISWSYKNDTATCFEILEDPCERCVRESDLVDTSFPIIPIGNFNGGEDGLG